MNFAARGAIHVQCFKPFAIPRHEQDRFLAAHPDLYEHSRGAVRLKIRDGRLAIGSLAAAGFATAAYPDWATLRPLVSP